MNVVVPWNHTPIACDAYSMQSALTNNCFEAGGARKEVPLIVTFASLSPHHCHCGWAKSPITFKLPFFSTLSINVIKLNYYLKEENLSMRRMLAVEKIYKLFLNNISLHRSLKLHNREWVRERTQRKKRTLKRFDVLITLRATWRVQNEWKKRVISWNFISLFLDSVA
jgi:hypothetical protein